MSEQENMTPAERAVQERLRALPDAAPDPAFRDRLRGEFVSGTIAEAPGDRKARILPFPPAVFALAAAAVLAGLFLVINRPSPWQLAGASGEGHVRVGDVRFPTSEAGVRLPALLRSGVSIHTEGEAQIDLMVDGTLAIQMAPGSQLTVPAAPGRWLGRSTAGRVESGEVRFVTGPRFAGSRLAIGAPLATVHVTGTTFAVISSSDSTCVCVLDGAVTLEEHDGSTRSVEAGMRRTVFSAAADPLDEEIYPMERMKLEMLRDQAGAALRNGRANP